MVEAPVLLRYLSRILAPGVGRRLPCDVGRAQNKLMLCREIHHHLPKSKGPDERDLGEARRNLGWVWFGEQKGQEPEFLEKEQVSIDGVKVS